MIITSERLKQNLQQPLNKIYCLMGDESLLIQETADSIRQQARLQDFTERNVFSITNASFNWDQVLIAAQSQSLFASKQLIEIRLPTGKPGREGASAINKLMAIARSSNHLFLFILPQLDKTTSSSLWFKALESNSTVVKINKITLQQLPQWIQQRLAAQQQSIVAGVEGQQLLDFFCDAVEGNLLAAHQEVQKLGLLFGKNVTLNFEQVKDCVLNVARFDVFRLAEAVLAGQMQQVDKILTGLEEEGEAEVLVVWALAEDIRVLHKLKLAQTNALPLEQAFRQNRVWGLKKKLFARLLPKVTLVQTNNLLQAAHITDGISKGIYVAEWPRNSWQAIRKLSLQLCSLALIPPQIKRH